MRIELPLPVKVSTNATYSGIHWSLRKQLADLFHGELLQYRNVKIKGEVAIQFDFEFERAPLDSSNCSLMGKFYEDAMVKHGIIEADNWKIVKWVRYGSKKGLNNKVIITVHDLSTP
jgi:hypothetical protein